MQAEQGAPPRRNAERPAIRTVIRVPIATKSAGGWSEAELITFTGLRDGLEHIAIRFGEPSPTPLVRIHSECLTGDVFGSARCDCGPQLAEAVERVSAEGGLILYMRQEGRGIGLYNKIDAYELQDAGLDTFAANRELDFLDDDRDYGAAADILNAMGVHCVSLLTNNPDKADQLCSHGIEVATVEPTGVYLNPANLAYLQAKLTLGGHTLQLPRGQS